jgi:FkbM family methyltransferase
VQRGKLRLLRWAANRSLAQGARLQSTRLDCGAEIECDLSRLIQQQLFFTGTYHNERLQLADWRRQARSSRVILDVGANVGIYSLEAKAANPQAQVLAFEPTPQWAAHLRGTIARNVIVGLEVLEAAASSRPGLACLQSCDGSPARGHPTNEGMNFIASNLNGAQGFEIQVTSLDHEAQARGWQRIDLMKIDVQGHEPAVLEGASDLLQRQAIGCLFIEINGLQPGDPGEQVLQLLSRAGYRFRPAGRPQQPLAAAGPWMIGIDDLVAMPAHLQQLA